MSSKLKELYDIEAALNATTILAITDTKGKIIFANEKFCEISKYPLEELIGKTHKIINSGYHEPQFFKNLWQTISKGQTWRGEIQNKAKDGTLYWVDTYIIPFLNDQGQPYQYVSIRHDITERKLLEHKIQQQLIIDSITGLPNTNYLKTSVEKLMIMHEEMTLLCINVDDFKSFNESLGNCEADQILRSIGEKLAEIVKGEQNILAKTYGDEFALVVLGDAPSARGVIQKIFKLFEKPIKYGEIDYYITISMGAVHYPTYATCYEELFQHANRALQLAKLNGKNTFMFFNDNIIEDTNRRLKLKNLLYEAIQQKRFTMAYQPQYNNQGELTSFEALVRWHDPIQGIISPGEFIPIAERTGLIIPLGYLLFELVLQEFHSLQLAAGKKIQVAFNLSLKQFFDTNLTNHLISLCEVYKVNPHDIKLEITESVAATNIENVIHIISKLRSLGMEVALDDYGTGFSSLQYLKDFQINCIKIDQSFVKDLLIHPSNKAIINSTIQMAHELGFTVLAEGVETKEQYDYLKNKGCDSFQGYFLGKPQPLSYYQQGQ
ncbi:EAL domain-containing protein [Lysinibacillus sp. KU-BSD001]|uniref:sensor domain-containing protein n=1 Tax=Lysinibacillus sp. KU-BSD001 TaxID=3141328 RepID=UPI0036EEC81A